MTPPNPKLLINKKLAYAHAAKGPYSGAIRSDARGEPARRRSLSSRKRKRLIRPEQSVEFMALF